MVSMEIRICLAMMITVALCSSVLADTYTWTDENGIHFTDDLQNVPPKYQKKAMEGVRV